MTPNLRYTVDFYTQNVMGGRSYVGGANYGTERPGIKRMMPQEMRWGIKLAERTATELYRHHTSTQRRWV